MTTDRTELLEMTDEALFEEYRKTRDPEYLGVFFQRHAKSLRRLADFIFSLHGRQLSDFDTDDVMQDVFVTILKDAHKMTGVHNVRKYVDQFTKGAIRLRRWNLQKQQRGAVLFSEIDADNPDRPFEPDAPASQETDTEQAERISEIIREAIDELIPVQRVVIRLLFFEGMSYEGAGRELGWSNPRRTVEGRRRQALQNLRKNPNLRRLVGLPVDDIPARMFFTPEQWEIILRCDGLSHKDAAATLGVTWRTIEARRRRIRDRLRSHPEYAEVIEQRKRMFAGDPA